MASITMEAGLIRNFCILAHIDHGKSTLADRFLDITGTVEKRKMREQFLDQMDLERERGITIKMQPVRMSWRTENQKSLRRQSYGAPSAEIAPPPKPGIGVDKSPEGILEIQSSPLGADAEILPFDFYILNLIDTPGHVDFSYEVSRALAAVEGAILLVDATQGVQAQTLANLHLAQKEGLVIIPAINKIDLPSADVKRTEEELVGLLEILPEDIFKISAKTGEGVERLLGAVVEKIPPPAAKFGNLNPAIEQPRYDGGALDAQARKTSNEAGTEDLKSVPLRALIFDSSYDSYQGVIAHIRVFEGCLSAGEDVFFMASGAECEVQEVGFFAPGKTSKKEIAQGEIGYIATGLKEPEKVRVGDTITKFKNRSVAKAMERRLQKSLRSQSYGASAAKIKIDMKALPGYKEPMPVVFASLFPENQDDYESLRDSLKKLKLNDAAVMFEPEEAGVLGRGMRVGFLGMLHMEIVAERLKREYGENVIFSNPSVKFKIKKRDGQPAFIYSAGKLPPAHEIEFMEEPMASVEVLTPAKFLGGLTTLVNGRDGKITETINLGSDRLLVKFRAPLREIIVDFYDNLKSATQGFASAAYELADYEKSDLTKIDILVNGEKIPAFAEVAPRSKLNFIARERVAKLKGLLPQELFAIAIQAEVDGRIIARETVSALRKDVTGYLYGGDYTRKRKLLEKQKRGKKKMKALGRVNIPSQVFLEMLKE